MTPKERVLAALNHEEPDSVPIHSTFTPEAERMLARSLGVDTSKVETYKAAGGELPIRLGHDLLITWMGIATSYYAQDEEVYTCEWGITWKWVSYPTGRYTEMIQRPLADAKNLKVYKMPDPYLEEKYDGAKEMIAQYGKEYAIVGAIPCTLFECAWYLRGFDRFMEDLLVHRDFAHELLDRAMNYSLVAGKKLIQLGVDIIWVGDDFGMQEGMIISPELWREYFKPRYAFMFEEFRKVRPDIKIAYHSDGNIEPIMPEYIEIGLDILNAVQPKAINSARLKEKYGHKLSFWGSVDIQEVLPYGTPEDVERETRLRIATLGPGGGLILAPAHNIQPDVPLENILAFYEAARKYGKYPLQA